MKATIAEIIKQMTLEEKAALCSGMDFWHSNGVERILAVDLTNHTNKSDKIPGKTTKQWGKRHVREQWSVTPARVVGEVAVMQLPRERRSYASAFTKRESP
jgi:hypothetical protein